MNTQLHLRIHKVTCVDETGATFAEKIGHDEIYLGGFSLDAFGTTKKIDPIAISSSFDDGEEKKYVPPRIYATFQLGKNFTQPRIFTAGFLLIEKDQRSVSNAFDLLYNKVFEEIEKRKSTSVDAAEDTGTGATMAAPAPLWPQIKDVIMDYVNTEIVGKAGDDIFPLKDVAASIVNKDHLWNGEKHSPVYVTEFKAHLGQYQVFYDWELK